MTRWRRIPAALGVGVLTVVLIVSLSAATLPSSTAWPLDVVEVQRRLEPPPQRWEAGHRGVDLAAEPRQPVRAAAAGTVTVARVVAGRGVLVVDHGETSTTYEPVTALVAEGSQVDVGQVIGRVAGGGHCDGRCLHWGLRAGETYLDPLLLAPGHQGDGRVRLLGADERERARAAAAARAARLRAAATAGESGESGEPGESSEGAGPRGRGDFRHPVPGGISSAFGMRRHPIRHVWKLHDGTDFAAACGTPIVAAAAGRVSGGGPSRGYGNRLMIDHGLVEGRRVVTGYNHAQRYVVSPGARVRAGQLIGYVGSTGYSTGCHLHLMVWLDGRVTNPMTWFDP